MKKLLIDLQEQKKQGEIAQEQIQILNKQLLDAKNSEVEMKKQMQKREAELLVERDQLKEEARNLKKSLASSSSSQKHESVINTAPSPNVASTITSTVSPFSKKQQILFNSSRASPSVLRKVGPPPQVWDRFVDENTGRAYYHCKETGKTTWKRPDSSTQTIIIRGE